MAMKWKGKGVRAQDDLAALSSVPCALGPLFPGMDQPSHGDLREAVLVWLARLPVQPGLLAELGVYLDERDRERAARFRFDEDRARFTVGRALARRHLGAQLGMDPKALAFSYTAEGQPLLAADASVRFSITHTKEIVAVAATAGARVGIDVEYDRVKLEPADLAARILSPADLGAFLALPEAEQRPAFLRVWTRKEAYLKARGEGIAGGLREVAVPLAAMATSSLVDSRFPGEAASWILHMLELPDDYTGCVACDDTARRIRIFNVPLGELA